jgi:hypothetical protein
MPNPFVMGNFNKYQWEDQIRSMFGGNATAIDPYTTGYQFLFFTKMPSALTIESGKFLTTVCQSVTVPGVTVNPIEFNGLNNIKWSVPGTVEYDSQRFTARFIEFAGLPITQIMGKWVTIFRNIVYGIADPTSGSTQQVDYKGKCVYATTLPDARTVQYASVFTGVYPTKIPTDSFSGDKTTQEKVEPEIEFSFDVMYTGEQVISTASSLLDTMVGSSVSAIDQMYDEASGV